MIKIKQSSKTSLSKGDLANIVSTTVGIVALIFSTFQYNATVNREISSGRPIISVSTSRFTYSGNSIAPQFRIKNYGARPAAELNFKSQTFTDNGSGVFQLIDDFKGASSNSLVAGVEIDFGLKQMVPNKIIYLYKLVFTYTDDASKNKFSDSMYYSWEGMVLDTSMNKFQFRNVDKEKVNELEKFINN